MWRYLPKRLELLLRIVLAFPKLSRMGKTSIGWLEEEKDRNEIKTGMEGGLEARPASPLLCS